jgi:hypothetical protein
MIKLKQLVKEIIDRLVWKIPENAPVPVVDVLHKLVKVSFSRHKSHIEKYIRLDNPKGGSEWIITNTNNPKVTLAYDTDTNKWWAMADHPSFGPSIGIIKDIQHLFQIIDNWV